MSKIPYHARAPKTGIRMRGVRLPADLRGKLKILSPAEWPEGTAADAMQVADPGDAVTVYRVVADGRVLIDVTSRPPTADRMRQVLAAYGEMLLRATAPGFATTTPTSEAAQ